MAADINEQINNKRIAYWLLVCAITIFAMVILGGVTRLTHSGLSMVEWKPLMGVIPPLSESDWQATFDKYKAFPEYQQINMGMDLSGFKRIFMYEYAHRVLGRLIGIIFFVPLVYFAFKRQVSKALLPKLLILFILGGLQGLMGWYMVKSGLVDNPRVSQYRLTAHLGLAVFIYGYMLWLVFGLFHKRSSQGRDLEIWVNKKIVQRFLSCAYGLCALIFIMILSGGLVAGIRAGFAYNTFPLMGNSFIPPGLFLLEPWFLNFFENIATVQFNHRLMAYMIFILVAILSVMMLRSGAPRPIRLAIYAFVVMLLTQLGLGITTLIFHVPVVLAVAHQGGAILLLSVALWLSFQIRTILADMN